MRHCLLLKRIFCYLGLALLSVSFAACATTKGKKDEQVRYRPQPGELVGRVHLPSQPLVEAVNKEIEGEMAQQGRMNYLTRAEVLQAKRFSPASFFSHVDLEPVKNGSGFVGFRIASMSQQAQDFCRRFDDSPRVGDILVAINGIKQRMPDDYMKAWDSLDSQDAVTFDLLRGDALESTKVSWPIR